MSDDPNEDAEGGAPIGAFYASDCITSNTNLLGATK